MLQTYQKEGIAVGKKNSLSACLCMWKLEINLVCLPKSLSILFFFFWDRFGYRDTGLNNSARLMVCPQRLSCLYHSRTFHHAWLLFYLIGVLRIQTQVLILIQPVLHQQLPWHLIYNLSISSGIQQILSKCLSGQLVYLFIVWSMKFWLNISLYPIILKAPKLSKTRPGNQQALHSVHPYVIS